MKKRNYVGLACTGHEGALAIVDSKGDVVFAEATERFLQNKRAFGAPPDDFLSIEKLIETHCEPDADIVIAKTWSDTFSNTFKAEQEYIKNLLQNSTDIPIERQMLLQAYSEITAYCTHNINFAGSALKLYCDGHPVRNAMIKCYDHHYTHAASTAFTSPFDEALCAVVDGAGEGVALQFYSYENNRLLKIQKDKPPPGAGIASLGFFYGFTLCGMCGFSVFAGDEWKVMGLAAYGSLDKDILAILRDYIRIEGLQLVYTENANKAYKALMRYARIPNAPAETVKDLAYTGQYFFSECMTELLTNLHAQGKSDNLLLSGGCALNSSYNGEILDKTPFENLFVFPAPADDGNAVGAALLAYFEDHPDRSASKHSLQTPYLGSTISEERIENLCQFGKLPKLKKVSSDETCQIAAKLLSEGKIIGWVQGRAEFGPRALGNRSILADPRHPDMKDKINSRVKFREGFRPFAPAILHEFGDDYFTNYQESPYMERTLKFREEVKEKIPAVVHVNGTGRLQTVKKEWNQKYHNLITELFKITNIPIVLNTSLNIMGKPIVHSLEDVVALFYTTGLDAIVINNIIIEK